MRPPYPVSLVPLFPQFLQRRNSRLDFPLRATERYGIDRPAYLFVVQSLGFADPAGATLAEMGSTYATDHNALRAAAATAQGVGLAAHQRDDGVAGGADRWTLTETGRHLLDEHRRAVAGHHAALAPIASDELARLAVLLERAFDAGAASRDPATRTRTARAHRYRWTDPASDFGRLDAAVFGLWQVRDDCHIQAWTDAGLTAPVQDVLTRLWRNEAATLEELGAIITGQQPADIAAGVAALRSRGLVEPGTVALTPEGAAVRERIETETDRYFFSPWPDDVGTEAGWIESALARTNAALA
ncbi:MAG TPA: hypothetical protein VM070_04320 [Candidatus Saccharimonadales bacterium]|nr:hypothetical protein [Candidatus Saccharimonadales bacterium]